MKTKNLKIIKMLVIIVLGCASSNYLLWSVNNACAVVYHTPVGQPMPEFHPPPPMQPTPEFHQPPPLQPPPEFQEWRPPTPEEEALETPLIDPIDLFLMFGGGLFKALFKGVGEISSDAAEKIMYYYFKDSSGVIADAIAKNGIKASSGFTHTLGYEGKVFLSEIAPDKISKTNLFSYGIGDADSVAKVLVKESDLAIPAQTFYYGEKGARFVTGDSGLYIVGGDGAKYLSNTTVSEISSLAPYQSNINNFFNNLTDIPRCLTRYWVVGGLFAYDGYHYLNNE